MIEPNITTVKTNLITNINKLVESEKQEKPIEEIYTNIKLFLKTGWEVVEKNNKSMKIKFNGVNGKCKIINTYLPYENYLPKQEVKNKILNGSNCILHSGTGRGKTTALMGAIKDILNVPNSNDKIVIAPSTIRIIKGMEQEHLDNRIVYIYRAKDRPPVYKQLEESLNNPDIRGIVISHSTLNKHLENIKKTYKNANLTLVIDEAHKLLTKFNSDRDFKTIRAIKKGEFKKVLLISATVRGIQTYLPDLITYSYIFNPTTYKRDVEVYCRQEQGFKGIIDYARFIIKLVRKGEKVMVHYCSKRGNVEILKYYLEKFNANTYLFTGYKKEVTIQNEKIIIDKKDDQNNRTENFNVIICTSALTEYNGLMI